MLPMHSRVVENGVWCLCPRGKLAHRFLILLEQGRDDRHHLPSNPANHFAPARVGARAFIVTAFDGDQALIDLGPFAVHLDGFPDHQIQHLFGLPEAMGRQARMIQRLPGLGDHRRPAKVGLELRGARKVSDVAYQRNEGGGLQWSYPREGKKNLALSAVFYYLGHLRFQFLQVALNEFELLNQLGLLKEEPTQASWVFRSNALWRQVGQFDELRL